MQRQGRVTTKYGESLTERHLQAIWYDGSLRPSRLRTTHGASVRVLDQGEWNLESGPDFRNAALEVGGMRLIGDVEVHLRPSDWSVHGHGGNPQYAHVVAHVTWYGGETSDELPAGCIHICLGDFLRTDPRFSPSEIDLLAYPYAKPPATQRPCAVRFAADVDAALAVIGEAGRRRIAAKARRLADRFLRMPREQVFYEEMFASLGYKYNTFPFRSVAQALQWRDVPCDPEAARVCYDCVAGMKATSESSWNLAHVRPANTPERRLEAAAFLFSQGPSLCRRLLACGLGTKQGQRAAAGIIREGGHVGAGRAGAMLANAVVPYALAVGALDDVPDWICPEDVSSPVRLTAFRMLGRDHNPALYSGNGLLIQGFIHIYRTFCLASHPACDGCVLGAPHVPLQSVFAGCPACFQSSM